MVLGLSRMQPRSARPLLEPIPGAASTQSHNWLPQRGAILFEATCDVMGGFPGFADQGGEILGVTLRISEHFVLVDEGKPHGFGIPVQWLDGAAATTRPDRDDPDLRVFYGDGSLPRVFSARFRSNRLAARGGKRAERAQDALHAAGLAASAMAEPPDFTLPWERTREFDSEQVIWAGHVSAPVRVGEELAPSDVWLSTDSLIWGSSEGSGLNRLAVAAVSDFTATRMKDRLGTPAVYLAAADDRFGRHEIAFVFNQEETPDHNFRERGSFLVGLRSRGIPEGAPAPLWQPWRLDIHPASRRSDAETAATPERAPEPEQPAAPELGGMRARLESWLPRLQTAVTRGLALPTVDEEQATVVAFAPPALDAIEAALAAPLAPDMAPTEPIAFTPATADRPDQEPAAERSLQCDAARSEDEELGDEPPSPPAPLPMLGEGSTKAAVAETKVAAARGPSAAPQDEGCFAPAPAQGEGLGRGNLPKASFVLPSPNVGRGAGGEGACRSNLPVVGAAPDAAGSTEAAASLNVVGTAPSQAEGAPAEAELSEAMYGLDIEAAAPIAASEPAAALPAVQHFENAALGLVADAIRAIEVRLETGSLEPLAAWAPLGHERDAAFAELRAAVARKTIKKRELRRQIERLTNVYDAGIRLRSLVELYDRGRLDNPELEQLRAKLLARVVLAPAVVPFGVMKRETAGRGESFFEV